MKRRPAFRGTALRTHTQRLFVDSGEAYGSQVTAAWEAMARIETRKSRTVSHFRLERSLRGGEVGWVRELDFIMVGRTGGSIAGSARECY